MTLYGKTFKEIPTRQEMIKYFKETVGKKWRGNAENDGMAVYRVDKGSTDNRVIGAEMINEKRYFIEENS